METLKKGQAPTSQEPFWTGQTIVCPKCRGKFKLKAADKPTNSVLGAKGKTCFYCATPGCGTLIEVKA